MNFQRFIDEKIAPSVGAFAQLRHVQAVRDGVIINLAPSMIGSLFLLLAALPIPGYGDWIRSNGIFDALLIPIGATMDLLGMTAVIAIAYRLAESYKVDALPASIIALLCYFMLTPYVLKHEAVTDGITGVVPIMYLGARGLFTAILVGLCFTEIYVKVINSNFVIKMPDGIPPAVSKSFMAIIPGGVALICAWIVRMLIDYSPFENIHTILSQFVTQPLSHIGGSLWGAIGFMFLIHFFWFFGIHGFLVVGAVLDPVFTVLQDANRVAFQNGEPLPNIFTRYWFDLYVTLGGAGASLAIVIAILFFAKSKHFKEVGQLSLAPSIFNINEPLIFGIPIVFNPILFIPWILVPIMNICTAYFATIIGFLPQHNGIILPWTMPIIVSGFIVAGWQGAVMQLINLTLSGIVWFSFIKHLDNLETQKNLDTLSE